MENIALRLHNITEQFTKVVRPLPIAMLSVSPQNGGWNISEITEHIVSLNSSYFPIFSALRAGTYKRPWWHTIPFISMVVSNAFGKLLIDAVRPENRRKSSTFPIWQPTGKQSFATSEELVQYFVLHQQRFQAEILQTIPFINSRTIIASPANSFVGYTFFSAIEILILHEERHLLQISETLERYS